ncbi:MAG: hypothetical protein KAI97_08470 [Gemmatimonadetes bacterium]|nr:hypothetical protein [Gemmatimonadota bacterium]
MSGGRIVALIAGIVFTAIGVWCLVSGRAPSTWARMEYRPSLLYWVVTLALLLLGILNLVVALRSKSG